MREPESAPWWHTGLWWVASVLVAFVHNGLWATPNLGFMATIAQNPGQNPFSATLPGDYLLTSLSMPSLAAVTGQTEPHEVARLALFVLIAAWAALVWLARSRFGATVARNLTVLLAAAPIVTVSMQWLGQPDPLTAACGIAMVLVARKRYVVALGVLAALTHPEQAFFMAIAAAATRAALPDRDAWRADPVAPLTDLAAALGGVILGRALTQVWFWIRDITIITPRSAYIDSGLGTFWRHHTQEPLPALWSRWGPLWLVILAVTILRITHRGLAPSTPEETARARRALLTMVLVASLALLPVLVTLDETRVYAVITAPLLAGAAVWTARRIRPLVASRGALATLVLTALIPGTMTNGTTTSRSDLDSGAMVHFLADGSVPARYRDPGQEPRITEWLLEPFDIVIDDPGR